MKEISMPKRPTGVDKNEQGTTSIATKRKRTNNKRSGVNNTKVARNKTSKNTVGTGTKEISRKVDTKKETTRERFCIKKYLGEGYEPEVGKYGKNEGYMYLPRSIFDWICMYETDWHERLDDYPFYRDRDIINTVLYYIDLDGYVYIQENGSNKFYSITIQEEEE